MAKILLEDYLHMSDGDRRKFHFETSHNLSNERKEKEVGKRSVGLKYKDLLAIKHALMSAVYNRKKMLEECAVQWSNEKIHQMLQDIEHEERLIKLMKDEAFQMIGGRD